MIALLLYFLLAVLLSFLCSILEAVLLSVSHAHIELLIRDGQRSGRILKNLKERVNRPLAAILTVNTVANTVGAAGVGAQALVVFGSGWVALASGLLTFTILVFSEVIPKTLGAANWKRLAPFTAYTTTGLIVLCYPMVLFLRAVSRIVAGKGGAGARVTRRELSALAGIGADEGTLMGKEKRVIQNLLRLKYIRAGDVMTPRSVMTALPRDLTVAQAMEQRDQLKFSRIPIYEENIDRVTGLVLRIHILEARSAGRGEQTMEQLAQPIHAVPESKSIAGTLDEFIKRREHLFLVVDEYGGTEGIVTLEDAIETLLGVEIVDEFDSVDDMRQYALDRWEKKKRELNV
jgi:CBS domain containing-hemolysin-like protein